MPKYVLQQTHAAVSWFVPGAIFSTAKNLADTLRDNDCNLAYTLRDNDYNLANTLPDNDRPQGYVQPYLETVFIPQKYSLSAITHWQGKKQYEEKGFVWIQTHIYMHVVWYSSSVHSSEHIVCPGMEWATLARLNSLGVRVNLPTYLPLALSFVIYSTTSLVCLELLVRRSIAVKYSKYRLTQHRD